MRKKKIGRGTTKGEVTGDGGVVVVVVVGGVEGENLLKNASAAILLIWSKWCRRALPVQKLISSRAANQIHSKLISCQISFWFLLK